MIGAEVEHECKVEEGGGHPRPMGSAVVGLPGGLLRGGDHHTRGGVVMRPCCRKVRKTRAPRITSSGSRALAWAPPPIQVVLEWRERLRARRAPHSVPMGPVDEVLRRSEVPARGDGGVARLR